MGNAAAVARALDGIKVDSQALARARTAGDARPLPCVPR